jgi:thioglycine synthase
VSAEAGIRSRPLAEVERLAEALLERIGIARVGDLTDLDVVGIPVYSAIRPAAAKGLTTVASGKGLTRRSARVSAMMEAIERRYCEPDGAVTSHGSYAELHERRRTLDPRKMVVRRGHAWTPDTPLTWSMMRCIINDIDVLVPALAVFVPFENEADLMSSNTIGLAAGNDFLDATIQGLYEVLEHDSTAFGEKLGMGYRVRRDTLVEPHRSLVEKFERAGLNVTIHVYTGGLPVPAFFVIIDDPRGQDGMLFNGGAGCHLNPEIALTRALTEAAQSRLTVISGAREDLEGQAYRRHASYAQLRDYLYTWSSGRPWIDYDAVPNRSAGDNAVDLRVLLDTLIEHELKLVLTKELAPPGLPFSVVKVVIPGSEFCHVDHRRVGARLLAARDAGKRDWIASWN